MNVTFIIKFVDNGYYTGRTIGKFDSYTKDASSNNIFEAMEFDSKAEILEFCDELLDEDELFGSKEELIKAIQERDI